MSRPMILDASKHIDQSATVLERKEHDKDCSKRKALDKEGEKVARDDNPLHSKWSNYCYLFRQRR